MGVATTVSAIVDFASLPHHRLGRTWVKDLRTEFNQIAYQQPIYPKKLCADRAPFGHHDDATQVTRRQIDLMRAA